MAEIAIANRLASAANDIAFIFEQEDETARELARAFDQIYKVSAALAVDRQLFAGRANLTSAATALRKAAQSPAFQDVQGAADVARIKGYAEALEAADPEDVDRSRSVANRLAKYLAVETRRVARSMRGPDTEEPTETPAAQTQGLAGFPLSALGPDRFGWTR